jgi:hypothetical protein
LAICIWEVTTTLAKGPSLKVAVSSPPVLRLRRVLAAICQSPSRSVHSAPRLVESARLKSSLSAPCGVAVGVKVAVAVGVAVGVFVGPPPVV